MAVDSRQKRASGLAELPWEWGDSVVPTGTINVAEREASITIYTGIAPDPPVAVTIKNMLPLLGVG